MAATSSGQHWTLTCRGLEGAGAHDDEHCFNRRRFVLIDVPDGAADRRVTVTRDTVWEHLGDYLWDWRDLPVHDRAQYAVLCMPGLLENTDLGDTYELIDLEGKAEAYSTLPYGGGLLAQPARMMEAFGVIRQVRAVERMREARRQARELRGVGRHDG